MILRGGVINLDELYDQPISTEFFTGEFDAQAALTFPKSAIEITFDRVEPELLSILIGSPRPCTYNMPTLLPLPEPHVETVRVHPFAKFGHIKQKARRMARERAARRAGA